MYTTTLNPTTGRHHAPTLGDVGEEETVIEVLPAETPQHAPAEPVTPAQPVPAGV